METNRKSGMIQDLAKKTPYATDTETAPYPISANVPKRFLKELGIEERNGREQLKVLEIYFDEPTLNIQEYGEFDDGEEDGEIWKYDLNKLPKSFEKWVIENLKDN